MLAILGTTLAILLTAFGLGLHVATHDRDDSAVHRRAVQLSSHVGHPVVHPL